MVDKGYTYKRVKMLGEGAQGKVYLTLKRDENGNPVEFVALKELIIPYDVKSI